MASTIIAVLDWRTPWSSRQESNRIHQLIREDLKVGRNIVSIWSDEVDVRSTFEWIDAWVAASGMDLADRLAAYQLCASGDAVEMVYPRCGEIVDAESLAKEARPDVVRVHSPAADLFPVLVALKESGTATIVYDRGDYWPGFPESWSNLTDRENEAKYVELADRLVAVSTYLASEWQGKPVRIIPNAVPEYFIEAVERARAAHPDIRPGEVIYTGGMPPFRFDWKLCHSIASARPDKSFTFVGRNPGLALTRRGGHKYAEEVRWAERTFELPNVRYIPAMPHRELVDIMVRAESAIMPLHVRPVTLGLSPFKVFEYITCGINTVSVPLADYMAYPLVHEARTAERFCQQLDLVSQTDPHLCRRIGMNFGRANTWRERRREFDEFVGL
ncbi:MAG: glycosyltransferase [Dactylosporangium sp.]|jgi:hypothetical protein|nr:glycosyltransferase [Dactylosporangium sp.]